MDIRYRNYSYSYYIRRHLKKNLDNRLFLRYFNLIIKEELTNKESLDLLEIELSSYYLFSDSLKLKFDRAHKDMVNDYNLFWNKLMKEELGEGMR